MIELKTIELPETWSTTGDGYQFHVESDGSGGWISASENSWHTGSVKKSLAAERFLGKRVRLVGLCRSANVSQRAGLLVRIEKAGGACIADDYMLNRPQVGTVDWQRCELVIDVSPDTANLLIGAHLRGKGQVWFKDLVLEEVSIDVATTDKYATGCAGIWDMEPVNLDFTEDELPELRKDNTYISEARRWVISTDDDSSPYEFKRSREVLFEGKPSALVRPTKSPGEGYFYQHFAAARFRNKRVRYSAFVKTKSVDKGAWLRANVFDSDSKDLVWKYSERSVSGTTDWTKLEIEFEIPREAYVIDIGADLSGSGEMYLGGLEFEVLGDVEKPYTELLPGIVLSNPRSDGWVLERAMGLRAIPDLPGRGIQLGPVKPGPRSRSSLGVWLAFIPVNQELEFSCLLRGMRSGQKVEVQISAWNSANKVIARAVSHVSMSHKGWSAFQMNFVAPSDTNRLHVWITSTSAQAAYLTQPRLKVGNLSDKPTANSPHIPSLDSHATKVLEARYKATARAIKEGDIGTVTFPIPGPYRSQVPITFEVDTKPKGALIDCSIKQREDGINWIAEVRVKPPPKGVVITWKSLVLIRGQRDEALPAAFAEAPPNTVSWLRSTKCVQSLDIEIQEKAAELAEKSSGLESYVRNVIKFTSKNRGTNQPLDSLDAKTALGAGGSCTSRANLAAALLRANKIPARTVAHLPAWMRCYLYEHWLVEYWHPGVGWVWIEPTMEWMQPAANDLVVLAVSSPDDEDKCDDPAHLRTLMPGGAYLSCSELSEGLVPAPIISRFDGPNLAVEQAEINGTDEELNRLFEIAVERFGSLSHQKTFREDSKKIDHLLALISDGSAPKLAKCLESWQ